MAKINTLELENVKRIKAIQLDCSTKALTVIGGKNGQGKTSALDAIAWALGGDRFRPSEPNREGSVIPAKVIITLDNGLIVERSGKNGTLKVTDSTGKSAGQSLLDKFTSKLALNLPKFQTMNAIDKAKELLNMYEGLGDKLKALDEQEKRAYDDRTAYGRLADSRKKYADELPYHEDAPKEPVSVSELIKQQQEILARNGENQKKRQNLVVLSANLSIIDQEIENLQKALIEKQQKQTRINAELTIAKQTAEQIQDQSTAEIEASIQKIETINNKVSANIEKTKALQESESMQEQYNVMSAKIESIRKEKLELLNGVELPLPGLSVQDGELIYNGKKWDCMSGSDQLKVSTAIVRKLNPECQFVLIDKLEQMDIETLHEFAEWLESEKLQVIGTRVSTGDECSIVIEDGLLAEPDKPKFQAGTF